MRAERVEPPKRYFERTLPYEYDDGRRGPNGRRLCRFCEQEVAPPRRTFCSKDCIHEWSVRRSQGYARHHVEKRDKGVCAICHIDTGRLEARAERVLRALRSVGWKRVGYSWNEKRRRELERLEARSDERWKQVRPALEHLIGMPLDAELRRVHIPHLWEMDHIVPVAEGGGACGLENLRTLCRPCHTRETIALRRRLKERSMLAAEKKGSDNVNRLTINREEIWALLSGAGETEQDSVVFFRVNGHGKLEAAASNGKICIEAIGSAKGAHKGEWPIDSAFLEKCRLLIKGNGEVAVIDVVAGGGVDHASIVHAESGDEIIPTVKWNRELASTQVKMSELVTGLRLPDDKNYVGSWFAVDPRVFNVLERVRVATDDCPVTVFGPPPGTPHAAVLFAASGENANWKGSIVPEKVLAPGGERDEPEEEPSVGRSRANDRQLDLEDAAKAKAARERAAKRGETDDVVIDDEEAARIAVEQEGEGEHALTQAEQDFVDGKGLNTPDKPPPLATEKPKKRARKGK